MREVERSIDRYFKDAFQEHVNEFPYVDISPMDNGHDIHVIAKLLSKNIDSSDISESPMDNRQEAQSIFADENSTRRQLCDCRTESGCLRWGKCSST